MSLLTPIDTLFNYPPLRKFFLRLRLPLGIAAAVAIAWHIDPAWFWPGLAVAVFGAIFQWWCFSCIMTSKVLALRGPYMLMRNPMYIARLFLILGIVIMTGNPWLVGGLLVVYWFYMVNRVRREEVKLRGIFGAEYDAYCRDVRRFWPTFRRFNVRGFFFCNRECFQRNRGFVNMAAVAITLVALYALTFHRPACWSAEGKATPDDPVPAEVRPNP